MFSINKIKNFRPLKLRKKLLKGRPNLKAVDAAFFVIMAFAFLTLLGLIFYQVRPLKLVDIKVPVATHKALYYPGEQVDGIFFGEIFYTGRVEVFTDIFCSGYRSPVRGDDGKVVFSGNSRPIELKGDTRHIGRIPADAPVGSNCVIQFVNNYDIKTPFGVRHEERAYYTQNFFIRDPEGPNPAEQQGTDAQDVNTGPSSTEHLFENTPSSQPAPQSQTPTPQSQTSPPNQQNTNNTPPAPAEPVTPPQNCAINVLGIKLLCD